MHVDGRIKDVMKCQNIFLIIKSIYDTLKRTYVLTEAYIKYKKKNIDKQAQRIYTNRKG